MTSAPMRSIFAISVAMLLCASGPAQRRRIDGVERARAHRFIDAPRVRADVDGHDQDRARRARHDAACGLDPVDVRHHQVHQHDVGPLRGAEIDRLLSVLRDP
ncbi:hypothetical protein GGD41_005031 [Paraburkholderia bryophila]|uniref:Uncharacterized protein n=1 Tax=Paraburkholderia bryophila TaxID=420952 RepID=A0A7Y9WCP0_9BURK|nr:hypothetical protein [Paraburkholderia bryophila]